MLYATLAEGITAKEVAASPPVSVVKSFLLAAALQQTEMVCYYIEAEGLHPDATWGNKPTALCYAALKNNPQLVGYLLDKGAAAGHSDALGMTPLHYAALGGCVTCIAALIARGAKLNAASASGRTPLSLAARSPLGRELLTRHGAALTASAPAARRFH